MMQNKIMMGIRGIDSVPLLRFASKSEEDKLLFLCLRNVGGNRLAGSVDGTASPLLAISQRCRARTNSSHDNLPSESISASDLNKYKIKNSLILDMRQITTK